MSATKPSTRKTSRAIALYTGGINFLIESAVREDGTVCTRFQDRTQFGYRWGAWRVEPGKVVDPANMPRSMSCGFSTLYRSDRDVSRLRLPTGGVRQVDRLRTAIRAVAGVGATAARLDTLCNMAASMLGAS